MNAGALRHSAMLVMVLVLAWTSITMAVARTQAHAGVMVTLCTPSGPELAMLGADGSPLSQPHPCPWCIIAAAALPQAGVVLPRIEPVSRPVRVGQEVPIRRADSEVGPHKARAPPFLSV